MSQKILLIGGSGVIGFQLLKYFINNEFDVEFSYYKNSVPIKKGRNYLDITDKDSTLKLISNINPDLIIHTAALANVDLCETNHELANSVNVLGTENILEGCKLTKSKIVYISTSYVFDGKKEEYFEDDLTSPSTYYGKTKEESEKQIKNSGLNFLILRTDQPYYWTERWQGINSVVRVIQTIKSSKPFEEITDWYSNPTYIPNFVEGTMKLIQINTKGIYHLVGSDFISRYNWSLLVCEIFNLNKIFLKPISSKKLNLPVKRQKINLNSQKILHDANFRMMGVKEGLTQMSQINSNQ